MERRSSLRRAIRHDAQMIFAPGSVWPCTISDFCNGGMYLTYSKDAASALTSVLVSQDEPVFTLSFLGAQGQTHSVEVSLARRLDMASGVRFVRPDQQALASLAALAGSADSERVNHLIKEQRPIMDRCLKEVFLHSARQIESVTPVLVERLKKEAVEASTDQLANTLLELSNQFQAQHDRVSERFLASLSEPAEFLQSQYEQQSGVGDDISLIDKRAFEDWLTSRVVITKAESHYHTELLPLKIRLEAIGLDSEIYKNSLFGPELFVLAYRQAVSSLVQDGQIERVLFKVFEATFLNTLGELYNKLNDVLMKSGVLPDLDVTKQIKKQASVERAKACDDQEQSADQSVNENPEANAEQAGANSQAPTQPYEDPLQRLVRSLARPASPYGQLSGANYNAADASEQSVSDVTPPFAMLDNPDLAPAPGAMFPLDPALASEAFEKVKGMIQTLGQLDASAEIARLEDKFTTEELQKGLQVLQAAAIEQGADDERRLLDRVLDYLSDDAGEQKGIAQEQQVAIDVVDRFFVSLKQNPHLSDSALEQLNKLEIPMLKVLLQDENLFSENSQAVRQVINRIAQLGSKGGRLSPSNQSKVEALVRRIVENFEQDTQVFDEVLQTLDEMVERQAKSYSKNVERVAAAAEGVHRVDQAKQAVQQALSQRFDGQVIPKAVQVLVDNGWQELLNLSHIKHGPDSNEWQSQLAVLDALLSFGAEPEKGLDLKTVLPQIQAGLKLVPGANAAPELVRQELKHFIELAPTQQHESVEPKVEQLEESEDSKASRNAATLKELKPWIQRVRAIPLGSWMRLHKADQDDQFMRLVWVAQGYSKFVFVNHQGMKVVELGLFKFARYLRDKRIEPDPSYDVPMVNQGLDDMIKDVYDRLAYESSHDGSSHLLNYAETCRQIRQSMAAGDRQETCGMRCYRVYEVREEVQRAPSPAVAEKVGDLLSELCVEGALVGRLNAFDFVVYSPGEDVIHLGELGLQKLTALQAELDQQGILFGLEVGEHQGTLGYNNPESMIDKACSELTVIIDEEASAQFESQGRGAERSVTEEAAAVHHSRARIEALLDNFNGYEDDFFEIFYQRTMAISERAADVEQNELLCSERGSGYSFVPEIQLEAEALDQWWLKRLLQRYDEALPQWDGLGEIRIKLSAFALRSDEICKRLTEYAEQGRVNPDEVWFDLYDSVDIDDLHAAADRMLNLHALGYRFCLDQFGSVRAPFQLIRSLPVQMIKVDEAYVDELNQEEVAEQLEQNAGSIVEVAHYLGRDVLVSSVDSAICLQRMRKLEVDYAQGNTIARYELLEDDEMSLM